jgi:hypothetical protein
VSTSTGGPILEETTIGSYLVAIDIITADIAARFRPFAEGTA